MIRLNVDFCKKPAPFHAFTVIIFHLKSILLLMMKMNMKFFLLHLRKIRAEDRTGQGLHVG